MTKEHQKNGAPLSDRVMQEIERRSLAPVPRWRVLGHGALQWAVITLLGLAAGLSFGLLWVHVLDLYWTDVATSRSLFDGRHFLQTLLLWGFLCGLCLFALHRLYRRTRRGYRASLWALVLWVSLALGLVSWLGFQFAPLESLEQELGEAVPWYPSWDDAKGHFWQTPDEGRITGHLVRWSTATQFVLVDGKGGQWLVDASEAVFRPRHHWLNPSSDVSPGTRLRVRGEMVLRPLDDGEGVFRASTVYPWASGSGRHRRHSPAGNGHGRHDNMRGGKEN